MMCIDNMIGYLVVMGSIFADSIDERCNEVLLVHMGKKLLDSTHREEQQIYRIARLLKRYHFGEHV
jgi:hypothetical protein